MDYSNYLLIFGDFERHVGMKSSLINSVSGCLGGSVD